MNKYFKLVMLAALTTQVVSAGKPSLLPGAFDIQIQALKGLLADARNAGSHETVTLIEQELENLGVARDTLKAAALEKGSAPAKPSRDLAPVVQIAPAVAPYENSGYFGEQQNEQAVAPQTPEVKAQSMSACKKALAGLGFAGLAAAGLAVSTYLDLAAVKTLAPEPVKCIGDECAKIIANYVPTLFEFWAVGLGITA
jgi:hypothetical protein